MSEDNEKDIFRIASRRKLRFPTPVGNLAVEDLWDLPLAPRRTRQASIMGIGDDLLAKQVDLEKVRGLSILEDSSPSPELQEVNLKVAILREIARTMKNEQEARTLAAAKRSRRAELEEIIQARKAKEAPIEALEKELEQLSS